MTANSVRPLDEDAARLAGESAEFDATDAAGELDAAGALDLFLPDAALGTLRRFRPDTSVVRYAARLASRPGDGGPAGRQAGRGTRRHRGGQLGDRPGAPRPPVRRSRVE